MADWILDADIYRTKKAIQTEPDDTKRAELLCRLARLQSQRGEQVESNEAVITFSEISDTEQEEKFRDAQERGR